MIWFQSINLKRVRRQLPLWLAVAAVVVVVAWLLNSTVR